jgi:hypothetical protein
MTEEGGMGYDRNALLWTGVEPLKEFEGSVAAVLVRFALVCIKFIVVVSYLGEVKVGESVVLKRRMFYVGME